MTYGYIGSMKAKPGCRDEVVSMLVNGAADLRSAGCRLYVVSVSDADADLISVSEAWDTKERYDASRQLPEATAVMAQAMPMLIGDVTRRELIAPGQMSSG
jgi:quinol monooxygenase YgiN